MAGLIGADPAALEALAQRARDASADLRRVQRVLNGPIHTTPCFGPFAGGFRSRWDGELGGRLMRAASFLDGAAAALVAEAQEQRRASTASTGGSAPGLPPLPLPWPFGQRSPATPGERIRATREAMERDLADRRQRLAALEAHLRTADGGIEEWIKDQTPGWDSDREKLRAQIEEERRGIHRLEQLLADPNRQFLKVDVGGEGRIIEVVGNLDQAENVAIVVPGVGTELDAFLGKRPDAMLNLHDAMNQVSSGKENAVIYFLDYDPPDNVFAGATSAEAARAGAADLSALVSDLREGGLAKESLTVVGHSYGSTTAGYALADNGLDVGRVAVVGSPGLGAGVDDLSDLGRPDVEVWAGRAQGVEVFGAGDAVALAPFHGEDPTDEGFGANRFSTGGAHGHSGYFTDPGSLRSLALIATGGRP